MREKRLRARRPQRNSGNGGVGEWVQLLVGSLVNVGEVGIVGCYEVEVVRLHATHMAFQEKGKTKMICLKRKQNIEQMRCCAIKLHAT
jgi:hypothetical protein